MQIPAWPRAWGSPVGQGTIKRDPGDFQVEEVLPETPDGTGEHLWLTLEKTGQNTAWVARQLARWADLPPRAVSYAGLKDRHAVTTQTFSLHLPGRADPDHPPIIPGVRMLASRRHHRKLKTGQLIGNRFVIRMRDYRGDRDALAERWQLLMGQGFPNYFGPQRFGDNGANLDRARAWIRGEAKLPRGTRGIHLSAVRGLLFNTLLAERVADGSWNRIIPGDFMQFREGQRGFLCPQPSEDDLRRLEDGIISPTASLPGITDNSLPWLDAREQALIGPDDEWLMALVKHRMARGLRKTRVYPERGELASLDGDPVLRFFLPAGSYATVALRELVELTERERTDDVEGL